MILGLSHATLSVRDLDRALALYADTLGMRLRARWAAGAYLDAGDLWLCLLVDPETRRAPLPEGTHLAFAVSAADFGPLSARVVGAGATIWQDNQSEGASLYFLDPDGHKLELHVGNLDSRLAACRAEPYSGMVLPDDPPRRGRKALLVVDVLVGIFTLGRPVAHADRLLGNVARLLAGARAAGAPVLFVRHRGPIGSPFAEGAPGRQIAAMVAPRDGEAIIDKEHPDAFQGSSLGRLLREQHVGSVVVCGFASEGCVGSTVRSAYARGLSVALASDGHSTTDGAVLDAERIVAHENAVLARFANVVPTAAIVFAPVTGAP